MADTTVLGQTEGSLDRGGCCFSTRSDERSRGRSDTCEGQRRQYGWAEPLQNPVVLSIGSEGITWVGGYCSSCGRCTRVSVGSG